MDAKGLVKDVNLEEKDRTISYINKSGTTESKNVRFLKFQIADTYNSGSETGIQQANAVIAVKDAKGNVLWSWHIWVTDFKTDDTWNRGHELQTVRSNITNAEYTMMANNLGWCDGNTKVYSGDEVTICFTQTSNPTQEKHLTVLLKKVTETGPENVSEGNSPFYQWGRKDPTLPSNGHLSESYPEGDNTKLNKMYYTSIDDNATGYITMTKSQGWTTGLSGLSLAKSVISNSVLYPFTYCVYQQMDNRFYNLWGVSGLNDKGVMDNQKTIYDPCPVGYKVPMIDVFASFSSDGKDWSSTTNNTMEGTWNNRTPYGWFIDTKEGTVFFAASGRRDGSDGTGSSLRIINTTDGYYWSAGLKTGIVPLCMNFNSTHFQKGPSSSSTQRSYGYFIRPVKE